MLCTTLNLGLCTSVSCSYIPAFTVTRPNEKLYLSLVPRLLPSFLCDIRLGRSLGMNLNGERCTRALTFLNTLQTLKPLPTNYYGLICTTYVESTHCNFAFSFTKIGPNRVQAATDQGLHQKCLCTGLYQECIMM